MEAYIREESKPLDYIYRMDRHLRVTQAIPNVKQGCVHDFLNVWNEYAQRGNHVLILFHHNDTFALTINNMSFPMRTQPFLNLTNDELMLTLELFLRVEVTNEYGNKINSPSR